MPDPDAVLRRLTHRLAPLERDLHRAFWAASTGASPEPSAARQRAEEAWLGALADVLRPDADNVAVTHPVLPALLVATAVYSRGVRPSAPGAARPSRWSPRPWP